MGCNLDIKLLPQDFKTILKTSLKTKGKPLVFDLFSKGFP